MVSTVVGLTYREIVMLNSKKWSNRRDIRGVEIRLAASMGILFIKAGISFFLRVQLLHVPFELMSLSLLTANLVQIRHMQNEDASENQKKYLEDQRLIHIGLLVGVSFAVLRWIIALLNFVFLSF